VTDPEPKSTFLIDKRWKVSNPRKMPTLWKANLGVKQAIFSILQNEINQVMLTRGNADYALKVLDPAFAPQTPSSPKRLVWLCVGFSIGLSLSVMVVFLGNAWSVGDAERV
jgi:hypothetical protein